MIILPICFFFSFSVRAKYVYHECNQNQQKKVNSMRISVRMGMMHLIRPKCQVTWSIYIDEPKVHRQKSWFVVLEYLLYRYFGLSRQRGIVDGNAWAWSWFFIRIGSLQYCFGYCIP